MLEYIVPVYLVATIVLMVSTILLNLLHSIFPSLFSLLRAPITATYCAVLGLILSIVLYALGVRLASPLSQDLAVMITSFAAVYFADKENAAGVLVSLLVMLLSASM